MRACGRFPVRMGVLERCQELFKTSDLYEVLGIAKDAAEGDIRRSYYKVSLKVHPDRAPEDPRATEKFQVAVRRAANRHREARVNVG